MEQKLGLGIASFVCGLVSLLIGCIGFVSIGALFDIVAIILGAVAIGYKKQKNVFSIAGLSIGCVGLVFMILSIVIGSRS